MFLSVTSERVKVARGESKPGPTFEQMTGEQAQSVMHVLWDAKKNLPDTHGRYYDLLKRGKTIRLRRSNQIADSIIFAGTFERGEELLVASNPEMDKAWEEAHQRNNAGEGEEFFLLYA